MPTKFDTRQTVNRSALSMVGSAANDTLDSILSKVDAELAKLFEDRNVQLTDGGLISFLGTSVQFTQSLKLHINSKVAGGAPVIIDLGATTRNVSADGRMIYAVINRTGGTATVTDDATTLPAVTSTDQEVFLIAKRVDSPDGVKRLYFRNGSAFNEGQSARLGSAGSGSGSGSGIGDDLGNLTFKASVSDTMAELSTDATTTIDYSANKTDPSLLSLVNQYIRLNYDASKTVAAGTTTTNLNISANAAFTVKIGDFAIYGSEVKRITAVSTQASFTTEAFSVAPTLAGQITISQGVYTKDLNNYSGDGLAPSVAFSTTISQILLSYSDTTTLGDIIFDANTVPVIGYSASSDGTSYSSLAVRATNLSDQVNLLNLPTANTNLYVRFVANKTSGSGAVNFLDYKVFFHRDIQYADGEILNQAYCFTDGTGTEINCAAPSLVSGKTRIVTTFSFPVAVNAGTTNGSLSVYLNGQKIPRFIDSTLTPDASYKEISQNTIELDSDYSANNFSLEIVQDRAVVDASDTNTTNVSSLQDVQQKAFQAFVDESNLMTATTTAGVPASGRFYSSIPNRKPITDLSQDLKPRMGVERIMMQQIQLMQDEFGPNNEPVFSVMNDRLGLIRCVGSWSNFIGATGVGPFPAANLTDFVEITFYGTGLNLLFAYAAGAYDARASTDGGSEGSNIFASPNSSVLTGRGYSVNQIVPVVAGLTLGVHTVKIRNNTASAANLHLGFEILNESSSLTVQPGASYSKGKKLSSSSQSVTAYNSGFTNAFGSAGTRGGRVLVYQAADGSIKKDIQYTDAAQANLTSADHTNEEILRTHSFREFGAGSLASDFSTLLTSASSRAFPLDDGSTTLVGQNARVNTTGGESVFANGTNDYISIAFIGTGLDVVLKGLGTVFENASVTIDGGSTIGNIQNSANSKVVKIVSGLPYGEHVVRFTNLASANTVPQFQSFIVYGPKKPTLPSGGTELGDYNILANYSATATVSADATSTGTIRKSAMREITYVGTWAANLSVTEPMGYTVTSSTNTDYFEYTFFGTGFEIAGRSGLGTNTMQLRIDGVLYTGAATVLGAGATWTPGTSTYLVSATTGARIQVTGLTLGKHTVRLTKSNGVDGFNLCSFDYVTPIYATKSNVFADIQNSLPVGSNAISDNRNYSALKELTSERKAWAQAVGITSSPTTTSTSLIPALEMSCVITVKQAGFLKISYSIQNSNTSGATNSFAIYVNNAQVGKTKDMVVTASGNGSVTCDSIRVPVAAGTHKVDVFWATNTGTASLQLTQRNLLVEEA